MMKKLLLKPGQGCVLVCVGVCMCVELIYFYNKSDYLKFTEIVQRSSNAQAR